MMGESGDDDDNRCGDERNDGVMDTVGNCDHLMS